MDDGLADDWFHRLYRVVVGPDVFVLDTVLVVLGEFEKTVFLVSG